MRISFFTQNVAPFRMKWMDELSNYYDVYVYHVNEYVGEVNKKYINYVNNKSKVKDVGKKLFSKKIYDFSEIFKDKHELIILDGYGFLAQFFLIIVLKIKRIKFMMTIDGGFINRKENIIKKKLKTWILSSTNIFFSTSEETDSFIKYYNRKEVMIFRHKFSSITKKDIVMKIDLDTKMKYRKELDICDKYTLITVGKFIPVKGFDIIINSLKYVKADVQLLIVGGNKNEAYKQFITDDICNRIKFIDFCDYVVLKKYYLASDVFITASRGDVWGLVVGEAMSCGLPVITSDKCIAGLSLVEPGKNGFVFSVENFKELAYYIDCLNDKNEQKKMQQENLNKIKDYSIENAVIDDVKSIEIIKKII